MNATTEECLQLDHHIEFSCASSGPVEIAVPRVLMYKDPWYHGYSVLANDNRIRQLARDAGVSTKLLGHVSENGGRTIGYLLEPVAATLATIENLKDCQAVLQKLHELGIAHGSLNPTSFLILNDGSGALLQGFHSSFETSDLELLAKEMSQVAEFLPGLTSR